MKIKFIKMQALSNDFVVIDNIGNSSLSLSTENIIFLCNRRLGIGCDQLVIMESPSNKQADAKLMFYNNDASFSSACGNATRCIVKYLSEKLNKSNIFVECNDDPELITGNMLADGNVKLNLLAPKFGWQDIPLAKPINNNTVNFNLPHIESGFVVNVGNPHIVFFVEKINALNIENIARSVQQNELFKEGVNVNFAEVLARDYIRLKTYERGSGLTPACGTGACATTIAAIQLYNLNHNIRISSEGGDLQVIYQNHKLAMIGEAHIAFDGIINIK